MLPPTLFRAWLSCAAVASAAAISPGPISAAPTLTPELDSETAHHQWPPTNASWRGNTGLNVVLAPTASWECSGGECTGRGDCVCEPQVIWEPAEGLFRLWYRGGWGNSSIGVATSRDGRVFRKDPRNPVYPGEQPYVLKDADGTYWLQTTLGPDISIATSSDGYNWTTVTAGVSHDKPAGFVGWGNRVFWREGAAWRSLQELATASGWHIWLYSSRDGRAWRLENSGRQVHGLEAVAGGTASGPSFASIDGVSAPRGADGLYSLWYHASARAGDLPSDVYHAVSADLLSWHNATRVVQHKGSGFEVDQVADPSAVVVGDRAWLFVDGENNAGPGACHIGVVTSPAWAGSVHPTPAPPAPVWSNCSVYNCSCAAEASYYCIVPGVAWGCAPTLAQEWWSQHACMTSPGACSVSSAPGCQIARSESPSPSPSDVAIVSSLKSDDGVSSSGFPAPGPALPSFPRFHLTFARFATAVNDPNGVQWFDGAWHYFFQHRAGTWWSPPRGVPADAERFAHAVSQDLLHWTVLAPAIVPTAGTFDSLGVWSGAGFVSKDTGGSHAGLTYRGAGGTGVGVALSTKGSNTEFKKLGDLFSLANGDGLPVWRTLDGKWHGGGAVDTSATQHGRAVTYTSRSSTAGTTFPPQVTDWIVDSVPLLTVADMAPNWLGSTCCCPDFFPVDPPDTATPLASNSGTWATKFSSYVKGPPKTGMLDTPEYFLLGEYDQARGSFATHRVDGSVALAGTLAGRLFPADFGASFAGQSFWDPVLRRRLYASWLASANNTHTLPRELTIAPDEDNATQRVVQFKPLRELVALRLKDSSTLSLDGAARGVGYEQMDLVATFEPPTGGWEAVSAASCSFGVHIRLVNSSTAHTSAGHTIAVQSRCDSAAGSEGCAELSEVNALRMEQTFRNGAASTPDRSATLTLDHGRSEIPASRIPLAMLFGGARLTGGPVVLPKHGASLELRVIVDHALVEAFADGRGTVSGFAPRVATDYDALATGVALFSSCDGVVGHAEYWEMASAPVVVKTDDGRANSRHPSHTYTYIYT
jgi:sucrose-6-phosphate hydrolase SacC (GH32 family)